MVGIPTFIPSSWSSASRRSPRSSSRSRAGTASAASTDQVRRAQELPGPRHASTRRSGRPSSTTSSGSAVFLFVATPLGIFFAVLLDKKIRGTRFYQSALYLPVVLSLAIVGFIWQLQYAPDDRASSTACWARTAQGNRHRLARGPDINLWAVLVAASWRHVGYVMVLYLAG